VAAQQRMRHSLPAGDPASLLAGALGERWDRFLAERARARRRLGGETIHDLRVALRRLIAAVNVADAILPRSALRKSARELRRHLKALNDLRDVSVQLLALRGLERRFPLLRTYAAHLRRQRQELVRKARAEIAAMDPSRTLKQVTEAGEQLFAFFASPAAQHAAEAMLIGNVALAYRRVLERRAELSSANLRSIHRMRVAFKKYRYTLEVARPALPWADREHGKAMNAFQTMMGEIQDLQVLSAGIRHFALGHPRARTSPFLPVYQYLLALRKQRIETFLRSADQVLLLYRSEN
jgi:CHAD domain-containing protein